MIGSWPSKQNSWPKNSSCTSIVRFLKSPLAVSTLLLCRPCRNPQKRQTRFWKYSHIFQKWNLVHQTWKYLHIFQEWNLVHQRPGPTEIFMWTLGGLSLEDFKDKDINMELIIKLESSIWNLKGLASKNSKTKTSICKTSPWRAIQEAR